MASPHRNLCFCFLFILQQIAALHSVAGNLPTDSSIHSGVPWFDTDGQFINSHGAGILKVGSLYYMVGEKRDNNGFPIMGDLETHFIGLSLYSSQDLVNWKHLEDPLDPMENSEISSQSIVERPKLVFNKANNEYLIFMHTWDKFGNVGIATSSKVEGPYHYQGVLKFDNGNPVLGGDLGVFVDTDGTAYLLETNGAVYQLSKDYKTALSKPLARPLAIDSLESPVMFQCGGIYYYVASRMHWWHHGDNLYATANSVQGPWSPHGAICPNGTMTWNSQATFVQPVIGCQTNSAIYMGDRWSDGNWTSGVNVWQPLMINGTELSLPSYHPEWKVDLTAGAWKEVPDLGKPGVLQSNATGWQMAFQGSRARLYGKVSHQAGILGVTLYDETGKPLGAETTVDLYTDGPDQENALVYVTPVLNSSLKSVLKIRKTGLKNIILMVIKWKRPEAPGTLGFKFQAVVHAHDRLLDHSDGKHSIIVGR